MDVRPTSDRLRETLFNVITPRIEGASFLDLCAGSGAVGIEAISRGASHVTFIERSTRMRALIQSNLDLCRVPGEQTEVIRSEAATFLRQAIAGGRAPWDLIFFDPPYSANYLRVLELFGSDTAELLGDDGLLVVEHDHRNPLPESFGSLHRRRVLKQGDSALSFYDSASD
jgi:16S rRNA (guanine966-N2)-methyltransferase